MPSASLRSSSSVLCVTAALMGMCAVPASASAARPSFTQTLRALLAKTKPAPTRPAPVTPAPAPAQPAPTTVDPAPATSTPTPAAPTAAAAAAAVTTTAITNEMTQSCQDTPTFKAFALFGDLSDYAFAPGGSFESGAPGWTLSGASVVDTNETLGIFAGDKALKIKDGGRVTSPWFCVTPAHPHFRYVTYGGEVEMEIDYKVIGDSDIDDDLVGETNGGRTWGPSLQHELATEIPASKLAKGVLARIIFDAEDDIYVDNVLVDPYRRG